MKTAFECRTRFAFGPVVILGTAEFRLFNAEEVGKVGENLLLVVIPILDIFLELGNYPVTVVVLITDT